LIFIYAEKLICDSINDKPHRYSLGKPSGTATTSLTHSLTHSFSHSFIHHQYAL